MPTEIYRGEWNPNLVYNGATTANVFSGGDTVYWMGAIFGATYNTIDSNPFYNTGFQLIHGSVRTDPAVPTWSQTAGGASEANLAVSHSTDHSITLKWSAALVPGSGEVSSYNILVNGTQVGTTNGTGTSFTINNLSPATSYSVSVVATDAYGSSGSESVMSKGVPSVELNVVKGDNPTLTVTTDTAHVSTGKYFSPYIDVGLPGYDLFNVSKASGITNYTLAFQNSAYAYLDPTSYSTSSSTAIAKMEAPALKVGFAPAISFGGLAAVNTPTGALIDEINQIQHAEGGTVTISIGGYTGIDPAVIAREYAANLQTAGGGGLSAAAATAKAAATLQGELQSAMNTFGVTHLDFDIETEQSYTFSDTTGTHFTNDPTAYSTSKAYQYTVANDTVANALRNTAIVALEAANPGVGVTFTVATNTTGLNSTVDSYGGDVLGMVRTAIASGVRIDALNLMVMDFDATDKVNGSANQADRAIAAANAVHAQFPTLKIALTPMIGQNDSNSGVTSLADAARIAAFAEATPWVVGTGVWQLGRDQAGTAGNQTNPGQPTQVQTYHSGVAQTDWQFSSIFQNSTSISRAALTNDLNGDFTSELVFRNNSNGTIVSWTDGKSTAAANLGMVSASSYSMLGADLNGDGKSDLVFRSNSGDVIVWNGGASSTGQLLGNVPTGANGYSMIAGDLNGDGKSDLIFRSNANGAIVVWDGGVSNTGHMMGAVPNTYSMQAADLNGDGKSDLVFRSGNGDIVVWDGGVSSTGHVLGNVGLTYDMKMGDLNGDGKSDLIFRYTGTGSANGTIVVWDGGVASTAHNVGMVNSGSYTMDVADLNGDGKSDLVFHDVSSGGTGVVVVWDGGVASTGHALGNVGADWTILGG